MALLGVGKSAAVGGGGGGYTGPGDLTLSSGSFLTWTGFRCFKASGSGVTKALRLINETSTTQADINCDSSTGIDLTAVASLGCGSAVCKVVTLYDQTGLTNCAGPAACDMTQATDANRPVYDATSGAGGKPCGAFNKSGAGGANSLFSGTLTATQNSPFALAVVSDRTANFTTQETIAAHNSSFTGLYYTSVNTVTIFVGGGFGATTATATDSAFHAMIANYAGASSSISVDGATTAVSANTGSLASGSTLNYGSTGGNLSGLLCEGGWLNNSPSGADITALNSNMHSGYSF